MMLDDIEDVECWNFGRDTSINVGLRAVDVCCWMLMLKFVDDASYSPLMVHC